MAKKHDYEKLKEAVKTSFSMAEVCRKLDIRPAGGNYKILKFKIKEWSIDMSHFTGQGWLRNRKHTFRKKPLTAILQENSMFSSNSLRKRLIIEGLKEHKCEECNLTEWNGKPIPLELDHCNGINTDNRIENLKILCNNCHAQTETYRGRNKMSAVSEKKRVEFLKFGETLTLKDDGNPEPSVSDNEGVETLREKSKSKECEQCGTTYKGDNLKYCSRKCLIIKQGENIPSSEELIEAFKVHKSFLQVGKKYNVSDNAVRKWIIRLNLNDKIKRKSSAQISNE